MIEFTLLTRSTYGTINTPAISYMSWDQVEKEGIPDFDAVVNLSGSNIMNSAWSKTGPVYTSRINTTRTLVSAMKKNPPKAFVQASAVGIYSTDTDEIQYEDSPLLEYEKMNFPQQLVYDWEKEAKEASDFVKTTIVRFGFVFGFEQNGVKAMKLPFGIFGIKKIGSGNQPFPWIHEKDLSSMLFHAALDYDAPGGIVNGVSPQIITQEQFSVVFNRACNTMADISIPASLLKLIGPKSGLLLEGAKVANKNLSKTLPSFEYEFPGIHSAIKSAPGLGY